MHESLGAGRQQHIIREIWGGKAGWDMGGIHGGGESNAWEMGEVGWTVWPTLSNAGLRLKRPGTGRPCQRLLLGQSVDRNDVM